MMLIKKILYFLPVALMIALTNYLVDPANLYHDDESEFAEKISKGQSLTVGKGLKEDMVVIHYLARCHKKIDILIMGSSRSMVINTKQFHEKTLFNASVSTANLHNFVAIDDLLKKNGIRCNTLIILLDPILFYGSFFSRSQKLDRIYYKKHNKLIYYFNNVKYIADIFIECLSISYFQSSINMYLGQNKKKGKENTPADTTDNQSTIFCSDGSRIWPKKYNEMPVEKAREDAFRYIDKYLRISFHLPLDAGMIREFETLVHSLKKSANVVVFWLAPYHPLVYEKIKKNSLGILDTEKYFIDFARKNDIKIYGSYDPSAYGFREIDFFDYNHLKNGAADRHLKKMAEDLHL